MVVSNNAGNGGRGLAALIRERRVRMMICSFPRQVSNYLPAGSGVVLHTENGMPNMGPEAHEVEIGRDLINAGKVPVITYPLTGLGCVTRVYTDHGVFLILPEGVVVRELFGIDFTELGRRLDIPVRRARLDG